MCVCLSVSLSVCVSSLKRLELSTPNLVHIYHMTVARHAFTGSSEGQRSRSHGYENCHGHADVGGCCSDRCVTAAGVGLHDV